ncbi:MAG: TraM recognition domain-containing protein [Balneola sp.]
MALLKNKKNRFQEVINTKLFDWPGHPGEKPFLIGDAMRGVQVFGSTGSGKSSASAQYISKNMLQKGFGFLVCCVKKDERDRWEKYAKQTNRYNDLVIFDVHSEHQFNPLQYEATREGEGGNDTANLLEILMTLYLMGKSFSAGGAGMGDERFWEEAMRRCLSRSIDLLKLSSQKVTFQNLRKIIVSAPNEYIADRYLTITKGLSDLKLQPEEREKLLYDRAAIKADSYCMSSLMGAASEDDFTPEEEDKFELIFEYFLNEFAKLSERTRSVVIESSLGILEPFMGGILKKHFSTSVSAELKPENVYQKGKIIILDFSVKEFGLSGILAQGIFKYIFMQAMERRDLSEKGNDTFRPVCIFIDEAQYLILPEFETLYASTARGSLVSMVYLTQNISNYILAMGQQNAEAKAKSLLANLTTHIFHANASHETNSYASEMIGQVKGEKPTVNTGPKREATMSYQEHLEYQMLPSDFTVLKTGDIENNLEVEGVVMQTGKKRTKGNFLKVTFKQNF